MAHPAHRYLTYLAIKGQALGETLDPKTANSVLRKFHIPPVPEEDFNGLVGKIKLPRGFQFHNTKHERTAKYMERKGVREVWNPINGEADLFRLLDCAQVVETTQILLMGRINPVEVAERLKRKHKVEFDAKVIELFRRFLWDVEAASYTEWELLLRGRSMRSALLACLHGSPDQARYRAGFNPRIEGKKTLKDAYRTIHFMLEATRYMPDNGDTAGIVSRLSKEMVNLYLAIYGDGAGLEDVLREFKAFMMTPKDPDVVPLQQLAPSGNYSGSGVKQLADGRKRRDADERRDADSGLGEGPRAEEADA